MFQIVVRDCVLHLRCQGFVLYGGRWIEGSDTGLATATFFFDLRTNTWRALTVASKVRFGSLGD